MSDLKTGPAAPPRAPARPAVRARPWQRIRRYVLPLAGLAVTVVNDGAEPARGERPPLAFAS